MLESIDPQVEIPKLKRRVTDLEEYIPDDQTSTLSQQTFNKFADFRDALKIPNRSATPATCRVGQLVEVGGTFYACTAADTWTQFDNAAGTRYIYIRSVANT